MATVGAIHSFRTLLQGRRSFVQRENLHLPELDRMALGLKGDVAFAEHCLAALLLDEPAGVGVAVVELGLLVLQDRLAIDDMLDGAVAVDLDLDRYPVVAVEGW